MHWVWFGLAVCAGLLVLGIVTGQGALAIPPLLLLEGLRRLTNPPDMVVRRALRRLRPRLKDRTPPVVETRVVSWSHLPGLYVRLLCAREVDRPALAAQLPEYRRALLAAMPRTSRGRKIAARLELRAISREAVDREGGWWGYDHNVPDTPA